MGGKCRLFIASALMLSLPGSCGGDSGVYTSLQECIAGQYQQAGVINPPSANVSLGSTFRERDSQELKRGCFVGEEVKGDPVAAIKSCKIRYSSSAAFVAEFVGFLGADLSIDRGYSIEANFSDFQQDKLVNISPSFAAHCLTDDFVPDEPIFASLLKVGSIEISFTSSDGQKLVLTPEILRRWNVSAKATAAISSDSDLQVRGSDVYVAYRKVRSSNEAIFQVANCETQTLCPFANLGYAIFVDAIAKKRVSMTVRHADLNIDRSFTGADEMAEGQFTVILDFPNRRDTVQLLEAVDGNDGYARLKIVSVPIVVENGPAF